jgi:hypothetical protein
MEDRIAKPLTMRKHFKRICAFVLAVTTHSETGE